jgi:hypothetical protein
LSHTDVTLTEGKQKHITSFQNIPQRAYQWALTMNQKEQVERIDTQGFHLKFKGRSSRFIAFHNLPLLVH